MGPMIPKEKKYNLHYKPLRRFIYDKIAISKYFKVSTLKAAVYAKYLQ